MSGLISGRRPRVRIVAVLAITAALALPVAARKNRPIKVGIKVSEIAYSPLTRLLYASVPGDDPQYPNSLTAINPKNGTVVNSVRVGNDPSKLAISDDGRYLYVAHDQTAINRYDLTTLRVDRTFQVTMVQSGSVLVPSDIRVMPGQPDVLAVALVCADCTGVGAIAIYDNGIARPAISADTVGNKIAFTSQDTLWAITAGYTPTQLWRYSVDSSGVTKAGDFPATYVDDFNRGIQSCNGMIYGMVGEVYDPAQASFAGLLNTDERQTNAFAIDRADNRAYFLVAEQYETSILSFDLKTYLQVGSYSAPVIAGIDVMTNNVMASCGDAGIAVAAKDAGAVAIFPLSAIPPLAPYVKPNPVTLNDTKPRIIPLPTNNITYDENRRLIYATVPGAAGNIGNSIIAVDPVAGSVNDPIWVGSEPQAMAISGDGTWLHTALYGSASIRRVRLTDSTPDQSFRLRTDFAPLNPAGTTRAKQIICLPGRPESVVVSLSELPGSFEAGSDGIAVYDDGIKRPLSVPGEFFGGIQEIQLSEDGATAYGIDWTGGSNTFVTMGIAEDGIQILSRTAVAGAHHLKCQNGLCFTEFGAIIDAKTQAVIAQFPLAADSTPSGQVAPDVSHGVVYFIGAAGYDSTPVVSAYDLNTHKFIASYEIKGATGTAGDFFVWGGDQLAFNTSTQIVLLPTNLLRVPLP